MQSNAKNNGNSAEDDPAIEFFALWDDESDEINQKSKDYHGKNLATDIGKLHCGKGIQINGVTRKSDKGQGSEESGQPAGIEGVDDNSQYIDSENAHGSGDGPIQRGIFPENQMDKKSEKQYCARKDQNKLQSYAQIQISREIGHDSG